MTNLATIRAPCSQFHWNRYRTAELTEEWERLWPGGCATVELARKRLLFLIDKRCPDCPKYKWRTGA